MSEASSLGDEGAPAPLVRRSRRWRPLRLLALAALLVVLAPVLLVPIYAVAPPVSTLMLAAWARGGSVQRTWTDLGDISPALPRTVLAAEDARFCTHGGVDWEALRTVIDNADGGTPSRGASTVAMQTAKNLFLWPGQSYLRKGLEIGLALYLDLVWSKRRVMEVYLNIVEWGPGVFGAEAAARHHFAKAAAQLTPREAALLAAALPNPIERKAGRPGRGLRQLAGTFAARAAASPQVDDCLAHGRY